MLVISTIQLRTMSDGSTEETRGEASVIFSASSSPHSVSSMTSSATWEKVALSPLDMISVQLEQEIHMLQSQQANVKQNKHGVDLSMSTGKAAGKLTISVVQATGIEESIQQFPFLRSVGQQQPSKVYVSFSISPSTACERTARKNLRTSNAVLEAAAGSVTWNETVEFDGIKSRRATIRIGVNCHASFMADMLIGETELNLVDLADQLPHDQWHELRFPGSKQLDGPAVSGGKLRICARFAYDQSKRSQAKMQELLRRKKEMEEYQDQYKKTSRLMQTHAIHPASFGKETARAALYLPGLQFRQEVHHPAAVCRTPLAEKSRCVTQFGRGTVISFRPETKMYVVQLDGTRCLPTAYLRQDCVEEEPEEPEFRMHMRVNTVYGPGELIEIRPRDGVLVINTPFAQLFMQKKDVRVPQKTINEMNTKELIEEASSLTLEGNEKHRTNHLDEAVLSYLRALAFLQRVDQDYATHKEKAMILQTMIRCHLNIGASKLKLKAYQDADIACTNAFSILRVIADNRDGNVVSWMGRLGVTEQQLFEEWPAKALFRRAQARVSLGRLAEAKFDLLYAVKLSPKDKACRSLLDRVSRLIVEQRNKEKKAWGGIFGGKADDSATEEAKELQEPTECSAVSMAEPEVETNMQAGSSMLDADEEAQDAVREETESWLWSGIATASLLTAGVAAVTLFALRQQRA